MEPMDVDLTLDEMFSRLGVVGLLNAPITFTPSLSTLARTAPKAVPEWKVYEDPQPLSRPDTPRKPSGRPALSHPYGLSNIRRSGELPRNVGNLPVGNGWPVRKDSIPSKNLKDQKDSKEFTEWPFGSRDLPPTNYASGKKRVNSVDLERGSSISRSPSRMMERDPPPHLSRSPSVDSRASEALKRRAITPSLGPHRPKAPVSSPATRTIFHALGLRPPSSRPASQASERTERSISSKPPPSASGANSIPLLSRLSRAPSAGPPEREPGEIVEPKRGEKVGPLSDRFQPALGAGPTPTSSSKLIIFPVAVSQEQLRAEMGARFGKVDKLNICEDVATVMFEEPVALGAANWLRNMSLDGVRLCAFAVPPLPKSMKVKGPAQTPKSASKQPTRMPGRLSVRTPVKTAKGSAQSGGSKSPAHFRSSERLAARRELEKAIEQHQRSMR